MFWLALAWGGDSACDPVRARDVQRAVVRATDHFASNATAGGEQELRWVREGLACLNGPVTVQLLGETAWLEAELAVVSFEVEKAWPWMQLARDLGVAPPEHLQSRHPIQQWLASSPPPGPLQGPLARLVGPNGERIYVDGQRLQVSQVRSGGPHLIQVFDRKNLLSTWWQHGGEFRGAWLEALPTEQEPEGKQKRGAGDRTYWETWLEDNPGSKWVPYAREQLDGLKLADAKTGGGAGLEAYLNDNPGAGRAEAVALMEPMDFSRASVNGSRQALVQFLKQHPRGLFVGDAREQLDALDWATALEQDTSTGYRRYLDRHPSGKEVGEGASRLSDRLLTKGLRRDEPFLLTELTQRFPGTVAAAKASAHLSDLQLTGVTVAGWSNEGLVGNLRELGLRVDRAPRVSRGSAVGLAGQQGQLWSTVTDVDGVFYARGELWVPGGRAPVFMWEATGLDEDAAADALATTMPPLDDWLP